MAQNTVGKNKGTPRPVKKKGKKASKDAAWSVNVRHAVDGQHRVHITGSHITGIAIDAWASPLVLKKRPGFSPASTSGLIPHLLSLMTGRMDQTGEGAVAVAVPNDTPVPTGESLVSILRGLSDRAAANIPMVLYPNGSVVAQLLPKNAEVTALAIGYDGANDTLFANQLVIAADDAGALMKIGDAIGGWLQQAGGIRAADLHPAAPDLHPAAPDLHPA